MCTEVIKVIKNVKAIPKSVATTNHSIGGINSVYKLSPILPQSTNWASHIQVLCLDGSAIPFIIPNLRGTDLQCINTVKTSLVEQ